jgi:hypothetical protein
MGRKKSFIEALYGFLALEISLQFVRNQLCPSALGAVMTNKDS